MQEILKNSGIEITPYQEEKLNIFKKELITWNDKFNLTSIKSDEEIKIKHFQDSIIGQKFFLKNANVVEIGSGGGFPSIPLMIMREDLCFTLIESVGKKCEFLKHVIKELNLNATVINKRAEDIGKDLNFRESFDVVTARAVARLNTLLEYTMPLIKTGGLFVAYKGSDKEELEEAKKAIDVLGGKIKEIYNYNLFNGLGERNIFVIEKIKPTPNKYPRGNGKERSKPL